MKPKKKNTTKRIGMWSLIVAALLLIPFVIRAPWSLGDYIFAAIVLFGSASAYELLTKNLKDKNISLVVGVVIIVMIILIWGWAVA